MKRVFGHLKSRPHGCIWHFVFTQQVIAGEPLCQTMARFAAKWRRIYGMLRRLGMRAGLATYHTKWSTCGGWHYHLHLAVEWGGESDGEREGERLEVKWRKELRGAGEPEVPLFRRVVCGPGPAMSFEAEQAQGEFWGESTDPVEQALQYILRDVLQGVEAWTSGLSSPTEVADFVCAIEGTKGRRLYGDWRLPVPVEPDEQTAAGGEAAGGTETQGKEREEWLKLGSMDAVLSAAANGVTLMVEALRLLMSTRANKGAVFRRLEGAVRLACG